MRVSRYLVLLLVLTPAHFQPWLTHAQECASSLPNGKPCGNVFPNIELPVSFRDNQASRENQSRELSEF